MGARSAEIKAGHGCAGGEAVGVHVGREALALKDVAASEADFLLDVGRAEHLGVNDGVRDVGTEAPEGVEGEVNRVRTSSSSGRERLKAGTRAVISDPACR